MAILTGRNGEIRWSPDGVAAATPIISMNAFKASFKTEYEDVSCFGDTNRVYIPGMRDVSGNLAGFWDSAELDLFDATTQDTPGKLELVPNKTEPTFYWAGLAYLDAEIDASLKAPKVTGEFRAAGPWEFPPITP
jgi:hypothetical protein